jgi:hypothetical protein
MSSGLLVQMKGCLRSFQPSMNALILIIRSRTEPKLPRRMAWRSMMPNQTSTRFKPGRRCQGVVHPDAWIWGYRTPHEVRIEYLNEQLAA